jgi:rhodanese-related sulfurtransferase
MNVTTISPQKLHDRWAANATVELIDVRTPAEYREVHVAFARNVPLDQLDAVRLAQARQGATEPLYVICRSGNRAQQACQKLAEAGCCRVINVEGGTQGWDQAGLPVVRGKKAMSLERQVRIAAGALVLASSVLGAFVSPWWIGLAAFVGAGLIFAGVTDTCGMALLLARMPWNQAGFKSGRASQVPAEACSTRSMAT